MKTKDTTIAAAGGTAAAAGGYSEQFVLSFFDHFYLLFSEYSPNKMINSAFIHQIVYQYMSKYVSAYIRSQYKYRNKEQEQLYGAVIDSNNEKQKQNILLQQEKHDTSIKANEQIKLQLTKRKNFFMRLLHDTVNPLIVVRDKIIRIMNELGVKALKYLTPVKDQIDNLLQMNIDILDQEKAELGQTLHEHNMDVNISKLALSKIELFDEIIKDNNIRLTVDIEPDIYIHINPNGFDRIFHNLFDNSVKYNKENGSVDVALKAADSKVFLSITDTGIGMPQEQLDTLFTAFYDIDCDIVHAQGTAIGLSLVKSILNEVSGTIDITSSENEWTKVLVTFVKPENVILKNDNEVKDVELIKPIKYRKGPVFREEPHVEGRKTIFFVENKEELILHLYNLFKDRYNFYCARNGKDALQKLLIIPLPDLIISDYKMDIMNGLEFYREVQKIKDYSVIPFILLSVVKDKGEILKALHTGIIDYIEKPFDSELLLAKIESILTNREKNISYEIEKIQNLVIEAILKYEHLSIRWERLFKKYNITLREREVIYKLHAGLSYLEIADELPLSIDTVKNHVKSIFRKCEVKNRFQLMRIFQ